MDSEEISGASFENDRIRVGDRFSSFIELEEAIRLLEQAQGITFWKRDSRTIQGAYRRGKNRLINPVLKYQKVVWTCMRGGRSFVSRANGQSLQNARSFKSSCLACVKVIASKDGQSLVVVKAILEHNHPPLKVLLPRREKCFIQHKMLRSFSKIQKTQTALMDEQGLDSKVQPDQEPSEQCAHSPRPDRTVTQRPRPDRSVTQRPRPDRSVTQRPRPDRTVTQRPRPDRTVTQRPRPDRTVTQRPGLDSTQAQSSELDHTLAKLKHDAGCTVEVLVDQDNILKGIFYQDTTMQKHFDLFPEVLVVTTACRLFDMYVYVQLAVDGNGHSDLVSMFVVSDSSKSISAMVDIFKRYNRAWERIQVVVMAEYRMERLVYASHYPKAQIFITPSRVTRTMKQEISQMDTLTVQQKQESLHLLQQIAHSNGEQSYQKNVEHLHKIGIQLVIDYYNRTWHPIREHWVVGLKECCLYSQNTTRQLAQFQRRLNQCIHALGDLRGFCQDIKTLVDSLRGVLREAAIAQLHVKAEAGELVLLSSVWHRYLNLLTPYASQLVARQLGLSEQVDFEQELTAGDTVVLDSASGIITITATSCTCPFATLNRLPCRHMFAFREKCGLNLFSEEGLAPRWCLKHSCRNDQQGELGGGGGDLGREEQGDSCGEEQGGGADQGSSEHTAARHHRRAARMARALMLLICATSSSALHEERIAVLQQVLHLWEEDKHATVVELIQVTV